MANQVWTMVFGLFKDGDELFEEAKEQINQKDYDKALRTLQKSIEKDPDNALEANLMITFIHLGRSMSNPSYYSAMAQRLREKGPGTFEFGLSSFDTQKLAAECECMAECITVRSQPSNGPQEDIQKGENLIKAAQRLQASVGNEMLQVNYYFNNTSLTGVKLALSLMAEGNELISQAWFWEDPKKAAEYQQMAYNFRRQLGETGEENQQRIKQFTHSCTCWICGRETMGEGLHFYRMSSDISPQQIGESGNSIPEEGDSVYVCRACYSAISRRSDEISRGYYDSALAELHDVEARINMQIAAIETRINAMMLASRR